MRQIHARGKHQAKMSAGKKVAIVALLLLCTLVGTVAGIIIHYPHQASSFVHQLVGTGSAGNGAASSAASTGGPASTATAESASGEGGASSSASSSESAATQRTKLVAKYGKLKIYSPIAQKKLTGVLFHQASYNTAVVLSTKLPDANPETVSVDNPVRVNNKQKKGAWADADALHLWREQDATDMDTSIDVGAKAGTLVHAPVSGTVVLVQDYDLYGEVPDISIHIQPQGHPELDVVLLHQYDPKVKAGDKVEGGITPISRVRDIAKDLTDVQLGFFTAPDDPGNHSHVQVNNADSPGYRETSLKGAYKVKE